MSVEPFRYRLRKVIDALGLNDSEFGRLCGIDTATLSKMLNGKRKPNYDILVKIHYGTGASVNHLLGINDKSTQETVGEENGRDDSLQSVLPVEK